MNQKQESAIVLLSSGLDSSVNLYQAVEELDIKLVITFDYGQKAFLKEKEKSALLCKKLNLNHKVIALPWLANMATSSLVSSDSQIPTNENVDISSLEVSHESAKSVWVSNRNGLFINVAACFAEELKADYIIVGFNKEEAATFPDNSVEFIQSINTSLTYSTRNQVKVKSYTQNLNKKEIVMRGKKMAIDFSDLWPCYFSGEKICGQCESCQRFLAACH